VSDGNLAAVRRIYAALAHGDVDGVIRECDVAVEYNSLVTAVEGGKSYRGHEGVRKFVADLRDAWDVWVPEIDQLQAKGDFVLAIGSSQIRGRGSGVDLAFDWGQVLRFSEGKVVEGRIYDDQQEAVKAFEALEAS
jgi:ketosteroid isomerase-like protein